MQSKLDDVHEALLNAASAMTHELYTNGSKKKGEAINIALEKASLSAEFFEAIRGRLRRRLQPWEKRLHPTTIDRESEILIVDLVAAFSVHANPLSGLEVRVLAKVVGNLDATPSTGWLQSLRTRYAEKIKLRKGRCSHKKMVLVNLFTAFIEWADKTDKILAGIAIVAWLVFNIDETRAIPGSKAKSIIADARLTQVQYEHALESTLYTMVGCYAADGTTLFILYIFKTRKTKMASVRASFLLSLLLKKKLVLKPMYLSMLQHLERVI